ncbi:hypothetical protein Ppa06_62630 [Planomonospora parontospora subsp. parontospora]|uniref:Uncharacterized protein n=2 Tax=Planomonospora parontospora TaxID=58119 RepID=A0AA37BC91_9ACTN|nr:hypothetical protein GCM10010126_06270 [Planomonospora parontospora]GII12465.1 hypothetical protein Ppa06_62630 [Planomonospora parontospora subsp. parontospora]
MTVDHIGTVPSCGRSGARSSSSGPRSGSICGLCEAMSTCTRRPKTPSASRSRRTASIASGSPASTHEAGALCTASANRPPPAAASSPARPAVSSTAAIAPRPLVVRMIRLRPQMIRAASSRLRIPATCAAATSPIECPTTASGSNPQERQRRASATWTAKITGWATSIRASRDSSGPAVSSPVSDQSA